MERLTLRSKNGLAFFDNDGVLIRGANGAFRQKKDMTGQYIHDRFVALDKAIDRLANYEDTGLEPEEIETLLAEQEDSRLTPKMVTCPGGWKGMRSTRYYCPHCKKAVRNDEAYCHKCGQAILFPKQEYDKENNKIWLNFEEGERIGPTPPDCQQTESKENEF